MTFALNMALVAALIALESLARMIVGLIPGSKHYPNLPQTPWALLYALLVGGAAVSVALRLVASRWRTREVILTGSLEPLVKD
jgi:hypothetical protein